MKAAPQGLSDVEIALMDPSKTVTEVMMVSGGNPNPFLRAFEGQRNQYSSKQQPNGAAVKELMREFVETRSTVHKPVNGPARAGPPIAPPLA